MPKILALVAAVVLMASTAAFAGGGGSDSGPAIFAIVSIQKAISKLIALLGGYL